MSQILAFACGLYVMGAFSTFCLFGFFVMLSGRNTDLWKPFAAAAVWPVAIVWAAFPLVIGWITSRWRE
jgi:hypothetical protein